MGRREKLNQCKFTFTSRMQRFLGKEGDCLYLLEGLVDCSEGWLLVIMENSPVTMENEDTFVFSLSTVAAIDTVVWTVVPLAGEHIQAFCETERNIVWQKLMIYN